MSTDKPVRASAKLGFKKEEAKEIVHAMNVLLANYHVHYQNLRNFHWNVVGADFFDIHEQFEQQYEQAKLNIDEVAERIRVFGMTPLSKWTEYLDISDIDEAGYDYEANEMVTRILNDYEVLIEKMNRVVEVALEYGDLGTEDLIKSFIKKLEKHHWMLSAFNFEHESQKTEKAMV